MKWIALLFLYLFSSNPAVAETSPYLYDDSAIVMVSCEEGTGTAFRVSDGKYLTANHVAKLEGCKINDQPVRVITQDDTHDIAELSGPKGGAILPTLCSNFKAGHRYISVGYANGWEWQTAEPLVAAFSRDGYRTFLGEIIPGMSGGPVFDENGKVRGINNMRWPARSMALKDTFYCRK
jgi:serine protease Do